MKKGIILVTLLSVLSGVFIIWQFKSQFNQNPNPVNQKNEALVSFINDLETDITEQENKLNALRKKLDNIEQTTTEEQSYISKLQKDLHKSKLEAGLLPVNGEGIVITVDDNKSGLKSSQDDDPNRYIIHYENILNIVSELKLANCEAISINNQRLTTKSEIRCVGNVILVNTTRLAPPFEIKAIGDTDLLKRLLLSGEYDLLKGLGFPVNHEIHNQENPISIPAYNGAFQFNYVKEGE
ncbi:Uncharacterized conserved protein YlxW, UPF0749 family [Desulfonispora thiosulfatigenes DSM 11270]|uniref:Uncharacterized conserved protein YlxW, UPF0749 family n=1 Tax=Desulfonispora thiosulfatigenes DSM 11270 TaxID=656914 RepID=A0A1W1V990_DESTI|nr:DUF881 domain-containing protein [Desulfonispora thiosulfatigenes]SMB89554.1 Uncharacterized conserved protein YlxW, UPF0749 family [Desulfonispora thiosulfatigenes DSM 11270]